MNNLVQELIDLDPADWAGILSRDYKIKITQHGDVASLRYDRIESPMSEPIVQQCRGMVVDTASRRVIAWPYNKFWDHGEHLAAPVNWATARVQEKLDGSLMILYWRDAYHGWCVASSGHPTAGGSFGADERTFREVFWEIARGGALWHRAADTRITYMLELCAAPNRVVVRHDEPRLVLHGARWLESGEELSSTALVTAADQMHCELVREFTISSIAEGFVVVDGEFNRVKIKSPRYVILHHMKG